MNTETISNIYVYLGIVSCIYQNIYIFATFESGCIFLFFNSHCISKTLMYFYDYF